MEKTQRTLVVHVEDKPGVLNRVASLFRRRAYNIEELNVGRTHEPGVSRMTIVVTADREMARRVEANLYKLIDVLRVDDITDQPHVTRALAIVKVRATAEKRPEILQIADVFRARAVDVAPDAVVLEITGEADPCRRMEQQFAGLQNALTPDARGGA
jgi:acetolactate synthase-1/3 small subunit